MFEERITDETSAHAVDFDDVSVSKKAPIICQVKERLLDRDHGYLPPKTFVSAKRRKGRKALKQIFMGVVAVALFFATNLAIGQVIYRSHPSECVKWNARNGSDVDFMLGNFSITEAKFIDAGFNVGGRLVQGLMAYIAYHNITGMLMRAMELTPVSFSLYSALTLQTCGGQTLWPVMKAFVNLPGLRPRLIMLWAFFSASFVVVFPTLMNLTSRYVPRQSSYITFPDQTMIPYTLNTSMLIELEKLHGSLSNVEVPLGTCAQTQDSYGWGVSTWWAMITWWAIGVWILGTYCAWMDAQHNCELLRKKRSMDCYRAVVDLAGAMSEALGPNMDAYSGPELKRALDAMPGIKYSTEIDGMTGMGRIRLSSKQRGKMEKLDWNIVYGEESF